MGKLLRFEFRKLFQSKAFYICVGIAIALIALGVGTSKLIFNGLSDEQKSAAVPSSVFTTGLSALSSSSILWVVGILVAILNVDDAASDNLKNILAKGYSRRAIYWSKAIVAFVSAMILCLLAFLSACLLGGAFWGFDAEMPSLFVPQILGQFLIMTAYCAIFSAISINARKSSTAIALCIIGPMIVGLLFSATGALFKNTDLAFSNLWLSYGMDRFSTSSVEGKDLIWPFFMSTIYWGLANLIGVLCYSKKEI
jgi:ABC-2 type transport system permease protein